jgi:transcriptional regulator with XRE-family HTH domain
MIDDDSTPDEVGSPNTQRVGRRLAIIREELGEFYGEHEWSQTAVANRIGLTQNIITRMEHGKGGLVENWLKVLNLYESQGYNLNWILTENNTLVSKLVIHESTNGRLRDGLLEKINHYSAAVQKELGIMRDMVMAVPTTEPPQTQELNPQPLDMSPEQQPGAKRTRN